MLSKAAPREMDFTATAQLRRNSSSLINRKIWLPKILYDGLPYFYLFAGIGALAATLYIGAWYWILPHYLLFAAACLHLCQLVVRQRRAPDKACRLDSEQT